MTFGSRIDIACKLLAHGPLTLREFREITGWPEGATRAALRRAVDAGRIRLEGGWRGLYVLEA